MDAAVGLRGERCQGADNEAGRWLCGVVVWLWWSSWWLWIEKQGW